MSKIIPREKVDIHERRHMTLAEERDILKRNFICPSCETDRGPVAIHYDHVIPLALGGKDHPSNIVPLCIVCHANKTKLDLINIARAKRLAGETCTGPSRTPMPYGKSSRFKRKLSGKVERR